MPPIIGELIPCANGYHLCPEQDLIYWLNEEIYEAEYKGECIEDENTIVVGDARLIHKCENWNERTARIFACWCARNTPFVIYQDVLGNGDSEGIVFDLITDSRSIKALKIAEKYANNKCTRKELSAARADALDAIWDATWLAVNNPTYARIAVRTAAVAVYAATNYVAWAAADGAARNARDVAIYVAWGGGIPGGTVARDAQTKELLRVLTENGKKGDEDNSRECDEN
jgi:hypothetical protein